MTENAKHTAAPSSKNLAPLRLVTALQRGRDGTYNLLECGHQRGWNTYANSRLRDPGKRVRCGQCVPAPPPPPPLRSLVNHYDFLRRTNIEHLTHASVILGEQLQRKAKALDARGPDTNINGLGELQWQGLEYERLSHEFGFLHGMAEYIDRIRPLVEQDGEHPTLRPEDDPGSGAAVPATHPG